MSRKLIAVSVLALMLVFAAGAADADPILVPGHGTFGPLSTGSFGGDGIPEDAVAYSQFNGVTLGLSAHGRYSQLPNPLANDGAGTFYALPGASQLNFSGGYDLALWNFNFYIDAPAAWWDGGSFVNLYYDFDPGVGTDIASHGVFTISRATGLVGTNTVSASQNLAFNWLATLPNAPSGSFDPYLPGEYTFALRAYHPGDRNGGDTLLGSTSMRVSVVPVPPAFLLGGLGIAVVGLRRRFNKSAQ